MAVRIGFFIVAAILWILTLATPAAAAVNFSGQRVTVLIPFQPGGGSDLYGRFIGEALVRRLPGAPQAAFHNVAGGGSTLGANLFQRQARPDGRTLLVLSASTLLAALLGDPRVDYDVAKWTPVLISPSGGAALARTDLPATTLEGLVASRKPLSYASQPATSIDLVMLLGAKLLGLPLQPTFGYRGHNDARLAFEKGVAQIEFQTTPAYRDKNQALIAAGLAQPLFSFGVMTETGGFARDPSFLELPTLVESYQKLHGAPPGGQLYEAYRAVFAAAFTAQKGVMLPEHTPSEVLEAYRQAAAEMLEDPEFCAQSRRRLGDYPHLTGAAAVQALRAAAAPPPLARRWLLDWLDANYGLRFTD